MILPEVHMFAPQTSLTNEASVESFRINSTSSQILQVIDQSEVALQSLFCEYRGGVLVHDLSKYLTFYSDCGILLS